MSDQPTPGIFVTSTEDLWICGLVNDDLVEVFLPVQKEVWYKVEVFQTYANGEVKIIMIIIYTQNTHNFTIIIFQ